MGRRKYVCNVPDCPAVSEATRCATHRAEADRARGSRQQRGYDADHDRARRRWVPLVATGTVACRRCQQPIAPDAAWHLDHTDDRTGYLGPSCAACNTAAGGRVAHQTPRD